MNAALHAALSRDYDQIPALTLKLPPGLDTDQAARSITTAIEQARASLTVRALRFQEHAERSAADGDELGQAFCRGQALANDQALATLDEVIIEVFSLWDQYDRQLRPHPRQHHQACSWNITAIARKLRTLLARAARACGRQ